VIDKWILSVSCDQQSRKQSEKEVTGISDTSVAPPIPLHTPLTPTDQPDYVIQRLYYISDTTNKG